MTISTYNSTMPITVAVAVTKVEVAMLDVIIIGGGPAALAAAIYLGRAGYATKVFGREAFGGTVNQIVKISNYPGFVGEGAELAKNMKQQAEASGAKLEYGECTDIERTEHGWRVTVDGELIEAKAVLIATGSEPRQLDFGLDVPVSYCAMCDGDLVKGKDIAVVGGANSAVHEAIYLAPLARELTLISHSPIKAEQALVDRLQAYDNVKIIENTEPTPKLLNQYDQVFASIGKRPATSFLMPEVLSTDGYVETDSHYQTKLAGLFAAGDVRQGAVRQVVTAAGEGAGAARAMIEYLKG